MKKRKVNKTTLIVNGLIILVVSALTLYYLIKNNILDSLDRVWDMPAYGFVVVILMVLGFILCDSFVIYNSYRKMDRKLHYGEAIGAYLYGNLGSNITPGKSGHYPFMLYYYEKKGITLDKSLNSITQNQLVYSFVLIVFYTATFFICLFHGYTLTLREKEFALYWFPLIGVGCNIFYSLIFILMAFCPPINRFLVSIGAFFAVLFKKASSKEEYKEEQKYKMEIYKNQILYLMKHFHYAIPSIVAYSGFVICMYNLPYVIYLLLSGASFQFHDLFFFFALTQAMTYCTNLVPVPANTGVAEYVFLTVFAVAISEESILFCTMIIWRLALCYFQITLDFIYFIVSMICDSKKKSMFEENMKPSFNE